MQRVDEQTRSKILMEKATRTEKFKNEDYLPFEIGDEVLIKNMTAKYPRFLGPYRVVSRRGPQLSYEVANNTGQKFIRHVSHLKQYKSRDQPDREALADVSDDNPSANSDDKLIPSRPLEHVNYETPNTSNFLQGISNFYSTGFILKPLRPLKKAKNKSNAEPINEEPLVENSSTRDEEEIAMSSTIGNSKMSDNGHSSSSESDLSVISRSDIVPHVVESRPKTNTSVTSALAQNSQTETTAMNEMTERTSPVKNFDNSESQSENDIGAEMNETPVLPRSFSLRDRSKIQHPSRPLDDDFQYNQRCSTPKADRTGDTTIEEFSTPRGTSTVENTSMNDSPLLTRKQHVEKKSHVCPDPPTENGKKIPLSKFTKSQLIELAGQLNLETAGTCKVLIEKIDWYYRANHPTWPRNSKGVIVITKHLELTEPTSLVQLTKDQLKDVYHHFNLEPPSALKSKQTFLSQLERQLSAIFPEANKDQYGSFILTSDLLTRNRSLH